METAHARPLEVGRSIEWQPNIPPQIAAVLAPSRLPPDTDATPIPYTTRQYLLLSKKCASRSSPRYRGAQRVVRAHRDNARACCCATRTPFRSETISSNSVTPQYPASPGVQALRDFQASAPRKLHSVQHG